MKTAISRLALGVVVGTPPLVVYLKTMAPGLIARGDSPKFQYLGEILGTSHSPGYPLYILLSWLFSQLPIGDVAWRVNFMTALFGALAAVAMFAAARALGASCGAALFAAWGFAFGRVFWSQAMSAEVYTLAALIQLGVIGLLIRWQRTRQDRDLLGAVAVTALGIGHHATIFMAAPAFTLFVLLVDWRVVLRPKTVLSTIALVLLGIGQYGYIVYRSFTGARYIEASARTPQQFYDLLRGRQYTREYFGYSLDELLRERSQIVWELVVQEISIVGVALLIVGAAWLLRRNWRAFVLVAAVSAPLVGFAMTYQVGDTPVFMIPVFLTLWLVVAVGVTAAVQLVARGRAWGQFVPVAAAVAIAAVFVQRWWTTEDLSDQTYDKRYVAAFLGQIETPAIVYFSSDDAFMHAVRYGLYIDDAAHGSVSIDRLLSQVDPFREWSNFRGAYLLEPTRRLMEARGVMFSPVELRSPDGEWLDMERLRAYRAVANAPCREATTNGWVVYGAEMMIGPRYSAWVRGDRLMPRQEDGFELTVVAGSDRAAPAVGGYFPDGGDVEATLEQLDTQQAAARDRVTALAWTGLTALPTTRFVTIARIPVPVTRADHANAVLGTAPQATWMAMSLKSRRDMNVRFCGLPTDGVVLFGDPSISRVELARAGSFAVWGWYDLTGGDEEGFRGTSDARAELQFHLVQPLPLKLTVIAAPAHAHEKHEKAELTIDLNGQMLAPQKMDPARRTYEWTLPASALRAGTNHLFVVGPAAVSPKSLGVGDDPTPMSLRVFSVALERVAR